MPGPQTIDLTGRRFARWSVLSFTERRGKQSLWRCRCDCGNVADVNSSNLRGGRSTRCKVCSATKHGDSRTPEYGAWKAMVRRCTEPSCENFHLYGGRGIAVCDRWATYENFRADMGQRPSRRHSLDRRDNQKGYCPQNCRWATAKQQAINRRSTRLVRFDGREQCMLDWARELGVPFPTIQWRVAHGRTLLGAKV